MVDYKELEELKQWGGPRPGAGRPRQKVELKLGQQITISYPDTLGRVYKTGAIAEITPVVDESGAPGLKLYVDNPVTIGGRFELFVWESPRELKPGKREVRAPKKGEATKP